MLPHPSTFSIQLTYFKNKIQTGITDSKWKEQQQQQQNETKTKKQQHLLLKRFSFVEIPPNILLHTITFRFTRFSVLIGSILHQNNSRKRIWIANKRFGPPTEHILDY